VIFSKNVFLNNYSIRKLFIYLFIYLLLRHMVYSRAMSYQFANSWLFVILFCVKVSN